MDEVKPLCAEEVIATVNFLSKASYGLKLEYVDGILKAIRSKGCTVRFANWMLKQMAKIQLNNEHQFKITDLRKELREGELQVRNHGQGRTPLRWKNMVSLSFVLLLVAAIFYIVKYKPFSSVEEPEFVYTTSFKRFTKEERKKIDSLLQTMNTAQLPEEVEIDPGIPFEGGVSLTLRKEFKNKLMEEIYSDLSKDADLKEQYATDSCVAKVKSFIRYTGVKNLVDKKGNVDAVVRNESEYDVVLYVSSGSSQGSVHSTLLKRGKTMTFKLKQYDIVTAVGGNDFSKYLAPGGAIDELLPSNKLKHHFCDTDANYMESMNTSYQLVDTGKGKAKCMILGDRNGSFHMIDIYSVMESY
ncbi:MAG: hypothetical protein JKY09_01670 [Crocinitomicaceae bacterium]|nr:hypothetical protein [Crocinitomicaceae bacterium]